MNICLICAASLSHHTLYFVYGTFGLVQITDMYHVFHWLAKQKRLPPPPTPKKQKHVTTLILKPTFDHKSGDFFGAMNIVPCVHVQCTVCKLSREQTFIKMD